MAALQELAGAACLSLGWFGRLFGAEMGDSPASAVEKLRVEAARLLVGPRTIGDRHHC